VISKNIDEDATRKWEANQDEPWKSKGRRVVLGQLEERDAQRCDIGLRGKKPGVGTMRFVRNATEHVTKTYDIRKGK